MRNVRFVVRAGAMALLALVFLWIPLLSPAAEKPAFRDGYLLVKPKAGRRAAVAALHAAEQARIVQEFEAFENLQFIQLPPGASVRQMVEQYSKSPDVEFAEPDYLIHVAAIPNEPTYSGGTLWHLLNTTVPGADIHAAAGWDATNSTTNIVAVVDSGVRYTHQDLASNMWINPGETPGDNRDNDHNGVVDDIYGINAVNYPTVTNDPNDDFHHGTRVAGIIGAVGNNGNGACGIAWRVKIMACKFLDNTGSGSVAGAIYCLDYARQKGAKVINASFADTQYSASLYTALNNCRTAGIIVVAAVGNDGVNTDVTPYYPACFGLDNILSVAATTRYDELAYYSNYGPTNVDLAAPGSEIYSTVNWSDTSYSGDSGTSYAAPCVAGAVALMRARWPTYTYRQIIDRLLAATDPLPSLSGRCITGGRLNLEKALNHWPSTLNVTGGPSAGKIRLQLKGEPYNGYILQGSTNLNTWTGVATNTAPTSGMLYFTNSTTGAYKFYRAVLGP